jgi:hypothetical protein
LSSDKAGNLMPRYFGSMNHSSLSNALTASWFQVLCAREVVKLCFCQLNWHGETLWILESNFPFWANLSLSWLCALLYYPIRIANMETLCIILVVSITSKNLHIAA